MSKGFAQSNPVSEPAMSMPAPTQCELPPDLSGAMTPGVARRAQGGQGNAAVQEALKGPKGPASAKSARGTEIPAHHVALERLAHDLAYKSPYEYTEEDFAFLHDNCLQYGESMMGGDTGFQATRFDADASRAECADTSPVLAFRGTESAADGLSDANPDGVGEDQFLANQVRIREAIRGTGGKKPILTGHSLGGALAQRAAASNGSEISEVVTYQSPGVSDRAAGRFNAAHGRMAPANQRVPVTHYVGRNDPVSNAGESALDGNVVDVNTPATVEHTQMLLQDFGNEEDVRSGTTHPCDTDLDRSNSEVGRQVLGHAGRNVKETAKFLNPWHQGGKEWREEEHDEILARARAVEKREFEEEQGKRIMAGRGGELTWDE